MDTFNFDTEQAKYKKTKHSDELDLQYSGFNSVLFITAPQIGTTKNWDETEELSQGEYSSTNDKATTDEEDIQSERSEKDFKYDLIEECLEDLFAPNEVEQDEILPKKSNDSQIESDSANSTTLFQEKVEKKISPVYALKFQPSQKFVTTEIQSSNLVKNEANSHLLNFMPTDSDSDAFKISESIQKTSKHNKKGQNETQTSVKFNMQKRLGDKWGFKFPEQGWTCNTCTNYNFPQRKSCKRCKKLKACNDSVGLPEHIKRQKYYYPKPKDTNLSSEECFSQPGLESVPTFVPTYGSFKHSQVQKYDQQF